MLEPDLKKKKKAAALVVGVVPDRKTRTSARTHAHLQKTKRQTPSNSRVSLIFFLTLSFCLFVYHQNSYVFSQ